MQNKIFKHLLTLFFVLVLLTIFSLHWNVTEKATSTKNPPEKSIQEEEQKKADIYLKNFGIPPEFGVNPEQIKHMENKTAENK